MKKFCGNLLFFLLSVLVSFSANSKEVTKLVYSVDLNDEVDATTWRYVRQGLIEASDMGADAVILHINTYGGAVDYADSIRTAILNYKTPIYAFIDNNAASAGALIAIACDSIYMRRGGNIGAATVVSGASGEAMPDKYQSYMRSMIRSTAESHGHRQVVDANGDSVSEWVRNPLVAEAMVDHRTVVPGICDDATRVLTFTAREALKYGFCEGICESESEIIEKHLQYTDYEICQYNPSSWDSLFGFFSGAGFRAFLVMIIVAGIYFELQTPGLGFPSAAAVVAAVLYFVPLYMTGTAADWEIVLFVLGVVALALELFVIPGFGVAGIAGIVLILMSLILAGINNVVFTFTDVNLSDVWVAIGTTLFGFILAIVVILWLSHKIGTDKGFMRHSALLLEQKVEEGYVGVPGDLVEYVGREAVAVTDLRPSGKVEIDGTEFDSVSLSGFVSADTKVEVVRTENAQLYVKIVK